MPEIIYDTIYNIQLDLGLGAFNIVSKPVICHSTARIVKLYILVTACADLDG